MGPVEDVGKRESCRDYLRVCCKGATHGGVNIGGGKGYSYVSMLNHIGEIPCLGIVSRHCCGIRPYIHWRIVFGGSMGKPLGAEL